MYNQMANLNSVVIPRISLCRNPIFQPACVCVGVNRVCVIWKPICNHSSVILLLISQLELSFASEVMGVEVKDKMFSSNNSILSTPATCLYLSHSNMFIMPYCEHNS